MRVLSSFLALTFCFYISSYFFATARSLSAFAFAEKACAFEEFALQERSSFQPLNLSASQFRNIIQVFQTKFSYLAEHANETLVIYSDFQDEWAASFARRWDHEAQIVVYGGYARRSEINSDAFALVLCHELGHLYGGAPLSDETNKKSVEGQADYFAQQFCMREVLPLIPEESTKALRLKEADPFVGKICGADRICQRALQAAQRVGNFLAKNNQVGNPNFQTPDPTEVPETLRTHPPVQCRLDTYLSGFLQQPRPRCWFAPERTPPRQCERESDFFKR